MDERLLKIEQEKQNALNQSNNTYNTLLQDNQNLYSKNNDMLAQYEQTQNEILDKQLAFNQSQIEQQKQTAQQNKEIEERKAQNAYLASNNPYGLQAERLASNGLANSGVSEFVKASNYNTYQNRLATANRVMQEAFTQYDNDMNEARLNNDVLKAQNALERLKQQQAYLETFYSNKATISQNLLTNNQNLDSDYNNRYQTEYQNIQNEQARAEAIRQWEAQMAEEKRQYDANMAWQQEQARIAQEQWEKEYELSRYNAYNSSALGNLGGDNGEETTSTTKAQPSSFTHINSVPVTGGPYQTVKSFVGSSGNTASDGTTNIDNQKVYQTIDGKYYVWDPNEGSWKDITASKKQNVNENSNTSKNNTSFYDKTTQNIKKTKFSDLITAIFPFGSK